MVQRQEKKGFFTFLLLAFLILLSSSCSRLLGYGVLLWSSEDPPVPSGTMLPVYIRSNIDKVWVVGIPKEYRSEYSRIDKFEVPLFKLEMLGSKKRAMERVEAFQDLALVYAETLQDGLPVRDFPDNGARRVYRLKLGEIVKILSKSSGTVAVGATGDPLPGDWYLVLTEDGTTGYCFSYRLKFFDHLGGPLAAVRVEQTEAEDPALERLLARTWSPESYGTMINSRRLDLEELSRKWNFDPGQDTGIARIRTRELDRSFSYTRIRSTGSQSWQFEGTPLQMNLRSETTLAVQFTDANGILRTLLFVALSSGVDDIILQESARREAQFRSIYNHGPVYTSNNYGTLILREDGRFNWNGFMLLVPQVIPASALGSGSMDMRLYLSAALNERYSGAFTLNFDGLGSSANQINFMYTLDSQGLRLEYAPPTSFDGLTVARRASSPLVIYFFRNESEDDRSIDGRAIPSFSVPSTTPGSSAGSQVTPGSQGSFGSQLVPDSSQSGSDFFDDDYFQDDFSSSEDSSYFFDDDDDDLLTDFWD